MVYALLLLGATGGVVLGLRCFRTWRDADKAAQDKQYALVSTGAGGDDAWERGERGVLLSDTEMQPTVAVDRTGVPLDEPPVAKSALDLPEIAATDEAEQGQFADWLGSDDDDDDDADGGAQPSAPEDPKSESEDGALRVALADPVRSGVEAQGDTDEGAPGATKDLFSKGERRPLFS